MSNLERLRKDAKLSRLEAARRLGVRPETLWRWERRGMPPSGPYVLAMAKLYCVSADVISLDSDTETKDETP